VTSAAVRHRLERLLCLLHQPDHLTGGLPVTAMRAAAADLQAMDPSVRPDQVEAAVRELGGSSIEARRIARAVARASGLRDEMYRWTGRFGWPQRPGS
jgi:hypothetical protein